MGDETYNGWSNRETWAAHLHLSNDEWLYNLAAETVELSGEGAHVAANRLEEVVMDLVNVNRDGTTGTDARLTMMDREVGSWWRVDWREVADAFKPDAD
jgi:hypothetical protein